MPSRAAIIAIQNSIIYSCSKIQSKALFTLFFIFLSISALAEIQSPFATDEGLCKKSKSPLYKTALNDPHTPIKIVLVTDHKEFQKKPYLYRDDDENNGHKINPEELVTDLRAVIQIATDERKATVPVLIQQRGNSRGIYCEAKPFRLVFIEPDVEYEIEKQLEDLKYAPDSNEYLLAYYEALKSIPLKRRQTQISQSNIFDKLGDDIKVVTHCGKSDWDEISATDGFDQDDRVLGEYYLYQLLGLTHLPIEQTQLALIDYLNPDGSYSHTYTNNQGQVITSRMAFFREPKSSLAKRCGLKTSKSEIENANGDEENNADHHADTSQFSMYWYQLLNRMINNTDFHTGHNTHTLYDQFGNTVYTPYDFDLSKILKPKDHSIEGLIENLDYPLTSQINNEGNNESVARTAELILRQRKSMLSLIEKSRMSDEFKQRMTTNFNKAIDLIDMHSEQRLKQKNNK